MILIKPLNFDKKNSVKSVTKSMKTFAPIIGVFR